MRSLRFILAAGILFAAPLAAQATASVCKDGSNSATVGRGACSGHGGVDAKATEKAEKAAKAAAKSAAKAAEKSKATAAKAEVKADKAVDKAAAMEVTCKDGAKSAGGRGACSGHGGIALTNPMQRKAEKEMAKAEKAETKVTKAAEKADAKADKAEAKAGNGSREDNNPVGSIAKCKDGMYSHAAHRRGACSRHGGVASWS